MADPIQRLRDEKIASLEVTIRYYVALAQRWENRAVALELELCALQERMAVLGLTSYGTLEH